ncbi:MAG: ATP-binding cassette domain-containing protein, partial [Alphaproteobacteria bacterium]|nr:ATP-binding cassette domain-containing protein [Alphaproteobacteria bacterium]
MSLETTALTVNRRHGPTLSFPALSVVPGARTLLLGPSGSGKTTWLSLLAGLLPPQSGSVMLGGQDIYKLAPRRRDRLRGTQFGFVFQTLHLLPALTLRQNIALAAKMAGLPANPERLEQLLSSLDLTAKAHRRPSALSQGEQQRAAIARAVFNRPAIIIADEPTSALDDNNA